MHSARKRLFLLNKRILFDEYSLLYAVGTICQKFPSMKSQELFDKYQQIVKPKVDACRFSSLCSIVKTLSEQEDSEVRVFSFDSESPIKYSQLALDAKFEQILKDYIEHQVTLDSYSEIYFLDNEESLETNKKSLFGNRGEAKNSPIINVKFYDWRRREMSNGHTGEGFQLFDDPKLQSLLRLRPDLQPVEKYKVNSVDIPDNCELTSWFTTLKFEK